MSEQADACAVSTGSARCRETPFEEVAIVGFKDGQAGVEQLALRDDDDVEPGRDLVATENLSYQSFSAISLRPRRPASASRRCPSRPIAELRWAG